MAKMKFNIATELDEFFDEMIGVMKLADKAGVEQKVKGLVDHPEMKEQFFAMAPYIRTNFTNMVKGYYKSRFTVTRGDLVKLFHRFVNRWVQNEITAAEERENRPDLY